MVHYWGLASPATSCERDLFQLGGIPAALFCFHFRCEQWISVDTTPGCARVLKDP